MGGSLPSKIGTRDEIQMPVSCRMPGKLNLTVVILTYNEAIHIARAIDSVRDIACRILIVDSFSSDATIDIALANGADVLQNKFVNQARQFSWAMENGGIETEWVLRLDADEIVEADLAGNLVRTLPDVPADVSGINLKRKHIYMDRWIRRGGRYPLIMLRLFRTGKAEMEDLWMDEHLVLLDGRATTLEGGFSDHNLNDLSFFTDKHNRYATREAIEVLKQRHRLGNITPKMTSESTSFSVAAKHWIKIRLYNRIPFPLAALGYFLYRYVIQLGFLDGLPGLVYHLLQGFWYRFLVGARVWEMDKAIAGRDREAALRTLRQLTGYQDI